MIQIAISMPGLEQTGVGRVVDRPAAINEPLRHMTDFCDVKMGWHVIAIRQGETRVRVGVRPKNGFEFSEIHTYPSICLYTYTSSSAASVLAFATWRRLTNG